MAAAVLGAVIALALTPVTPAGVPVIAATAACLVGLTRPRRQAASARTGRGPDAARSASRTGRERDAARAGAAQRPQEASS